MVAEEDEGDALDVRLALQIRDHRFESGAGGLLDGVAVDARAQGGEGDRAISELVGQPETAVVGAG